MSDNRLYLGPDPQLHGPFAQNTIQIVLGILLPTLAAIAVILRVIARKTKQNKLWWDDYLLLPAMVCSRLVLSPNCVRLICLAVG